jgi:hypothetical protein
MTNNLLVSLSVDQLRRIVSIKEQIASLEGELTRLSGVRGTSLRVPGRRGRPPGSGNAMGGAKPKRRFSAKARAKLAASAKARWAKAKAAGKSTL